MPPGLPELLLSLAPSIVPILIVVYIAVLLREVRSGIRDLNARTARIESRSSEGAEEG